jgi:hypothetical protein
MKPSILIQLDTDPHPSVFDSVVAVDSGVDHLIRLGRTTPDEVEGLVHGAIFTRGPADLHRTALFIGGSDVTAAEDLLNAVSRTFFGPFRVSVLFDPSGCNTTAAAAALAVSEGASERLGGLSGAQVAVLGGTGPVGQRVARLLLRLGARVAVGSRSLERAQQVTARLREAGAGEAIPFSSSSPDDLREILQPIQVVVSAGAAGTVLLPDEVRRQLPALRVAIDLNAVPPVGIPGIEPADRKTEREGLLVWGALGVGRTKMKIHRKAIQTLFTTNDLLIDAEQSLALGQSLE